jgi:long-chain fatty acid transport protein
MQIVRRTRRRLGALLLELCLAAAWARGAQASSTLEIIGAASGGNQLTGRVLSHGSAATYFNPSLLPEALPKIEVGVYGLATQGSIHLKERPPGVDVPENIYNTMIPDARPGDLRPMPTSKLPNPRSDTDADQNVVYAAIGMVRPLAGKSLVFGFYAFLPVRAFLDQKGFFPDEREQYFSNQLHYELLGDRLAVSSITFAAGSQLADWISVGVGVDVSIFTETKVTVFMPNGADQSHVILAPDIHTNSKFKPYFGVTVHPNQRLSLVGTLHVPFENTTNGENDIRFWNYDDENGQPVLVKQIYTFSQGSQPLRLAVGASFKGRPREDGQAPWEVGVQLLGQRWSQYRNRQGEHPLDAWSNTVSYAVGVGFQWKDRHVTADLGYTPSPVPDQMGRTNYVDNSRLLASLGIEGPVRFLGKDLEAGLTLFGSLFLPREVSKSLDVVNRVVDEYPDTAVDVRTNQPAGDTQDLQTNNPGYPGWKSTGFMVGMGATFRIAR